MNFPAEISPSTQFVLAEIRRRFHEFDAWMELGFSRAMAALEPPGTTNELRIGGFEQSGAPQPVVADNWGGLFDEFPAVDHESVPAPDASSSDIDAAACVTPEPTASAAASASVVECQFPEPAQVDEKKLVAQQKAERSGFLVARVEQERHAAVVRTEGLGASSRVCIGFPDLPRDCLVPDHPLKLSDGLDFTPPQSSTPMLTFQIHNLEFDPRVLRHTPELVRLLASNGIVLLPGHLTEHYDSSLDDGLESGFAHHDVPLVAAAAFHADAVGAAGGGSLASGVVARPGQTNCSTDCPARDRCFTDDPVGVLLGEEMPRLGDNNHGLATVFYMTELEVAAGAEPAHVRPWLSGLAGRTCTVPCAVRSRHEEKGYGSNESNVWEGFSILKQERDGGSANFVPVSCSSLDQDLMTLHGRQKDALHSIISEASGVLSSAVDKWRSQETGNTYSDDIYLCVTACLVDAGWKLQRRTVDLNFMEFPNDITYVDESIELCFSELEYDKVICITLDNDTLNNVKYEASMPDSLKTVIHDKCKVLWDSEFCQVLCFTDILNFAMRPATRGISKTSIIWELTHVVQAGVLLVLIWAQRSSSKFWSFSLSAEDCASGHKSLLDDDCDLSKLCSQLMRKFDEYEIDKINMRYKLVSGSPSGVAAVECKQAQASWVMLDTHRALSVSKVISYLAGCLFNLVKWLLFLDRVLLLQEVDYCFAVAKHLEVDLCQSSQWDSTSLFFILKSSSGNASLLTVQTARSKAQNLLRHEWTVVAVPRIDITAWFNYDLFSVLVLSKHLSTAGLLRIGLNWYIPRYVQFQPWSSHPILPTNIASELAETISVVSKLHVLDIVSLAVPDLTELGYDELELDPSKHDDDRYVHLNTWLDCKITSMPFCASSNLVDWKGMSDTQVRCHGALLFSIKDLQVPWDPGGIKIFHRLGGKPKLKKGGMLGSIHGWAFIWAIGLGLLEQWPAGWLGIIYKRAQEQQGRDHQTTEFFQFTVHPLPSFCTRLSLRSLL